MTGFVIALVYLGVASVWALTRRLDRHGPRSGDTRITPEEIAMYHAWARDHQWKDLDP